MHITLVFSMICLLFCLTNASIGSYIDTSFVTSHVDNDVLATQAERDYLRMLRQRKLLAIERRRHSLEQEMERENEERIYKQYLNLPQRTSFLKDFQTMRY